MGRLSGQALGDTVFAPPTPKPSDALDDIPAEVRFHFERLALEVAARGFKRYSSDAILHRIRWHFHVEKGNADFKCNNNWTAPLARWFMERHPDLRGFFETRERSND